MILKRLSVAICLGLLLIQACSPLSRVPAPEKRYYSLAAQRPQAAASSGKLSLKVRPFTVSPGFAGRELVFRTAENQFESDYYNVYFSQPSQAVTDAARIWLGRSGIFAQVLDPSSLAGQSMYLEGALNSLYADFREPGSPKAVIELQFFLLKEENSGPRVIFQKDFSRSEPFSPEGGPKELVAAQNRALASILGELEEDLRGQVK